MFGTDWRGICFEACILHLGIKEQILKEEGRKKERKPTSQNKVVSHWRQGRWGWPKQTLALQRAGLKTKEPASFDKQASRREPLGGLPKETCLTRRRAPEPLCQVENLAFLLLFF